MLDSTRAALENISTGQITLVDVVVEEITSKKFPMMILIAVEIAGPLIPYIRRPIYTSRTLFG